MSADAPRAVVLDLDGVVTDTATLHFRAWKRLFDDLLADRDGGGPFTEEDYRAHVDGRPRLDGIRTFLAARRVAIPEGAPGDDEGQATLHGLAARKNRLFHELLQREGVQPLPGARARLEAWRVAGLRLALVSSSRNAAAVIEAAGLAELFDVRVDGVDLGRLGLAGKPAPDLFLEAARRLEVPPAAAIVVEDAVAGVQAGRAGGFARVIGVAPAEGAEALRAAGADEVVTGLAALGGFPRALDREALRERLRHARPVLFLDYDGTLSPIVRHPEQAALAPGMHEALRRLCETCLVAVVSGRDRADVAARVGLDTVWYAGSHGFDIAGPGSQHLELPEGTAALPALDGAEERLAARLAEIPGAHLDRKRFAIAIHYRNVAEADVPRVEAAVDDARAAHPELRKTGGKKVWELRPDVDWDKGRAVGWLLDALLPDSAAVLPIYIGDDVTDEDAFRALERHGLGIYVGPPGASSAAPWRVDDPAAVRDLLDWIAAGEEARLGWRLTYDAWRPEVQPLREALCTLGNGRWCSRGAAEEALRADAVHYPGTYLAGGYDRLATRVSGRMAENEDLVNLPNWLCLRWRPHDGDWCDLEDAEVLAFTQALDLRRGVLERDLRVRDRAGRTTRLRSRRLVHMGTPELAAIEWVLEPEDWSGDLVVRTALDGNVINAGVARYRELASDHLVFLEAGQELDDTIWLRVRTRQSQLEVVQAARTRFEVEGVAPAVKRHLVREPGFIAQDVLLTAQVGVSIRVEKVVAMRTGRDRAVSAPAETACRDVGYAGGYGSLHGAHARAWSELWRRCDVSIDGSPHVLSILRLHLYHLLQTISPNTIGVDVGIPARGWHGEAYRGHVFWDELFILPYYHLRLPEVARSALMYRYRRLPEARRAALEAGFAGAMFPWQSGSDGREQTQRIHLNPRSGRWIEDRSHRQRHVNAAIAYNVWHYFQATGDLDFMAFHGAELMVEIARFWASIARFDPEKQRYRIRGVMGPDEYHDGYPHREEPGIDDNAYTNLMAVWCLRRTRELLDRLTEDRRRELCACFSVSPADLERWVDISRRMYLEFLGDGVLAQFAGYGELLPFDWEGYRERYGDIARLDRLLEAEGDTPNRYQVAKQADVLMLFYLFSTEELGELIEGLGYPFDPQSVPRTVDYYAQRTAHGSTLSRVVHAWVLARADRPRAWRLFEEALQSDVADIQGGTTAEGIHLGAMAGTIDLVQRCWTGLEIRGDVLRFNPCLPEALGELRFPLRYRGHRVDVQVTRQTLTLSLHRGTTPGIDVQVRGQAVHMAPGETRVFAVKSCES